MTITPKHYYQQHLEAGLIQADPQQAEVIEILDAVYQDLLKNARSQSSSFKWFRRKKVVKGLYVWGSVGVGKTFLMDSFYSCYPYKKLRLHFHKFLERIQAELAAVQGQENPLQIIAKKIASEADVLCFDEFFVSNIADAMVLGELFTALFAEGCCLVTTSNVAPDDLYKDGLQRERFLPAIKAIKENVRVYHMISHHDYRLTHLRQAGVYFSPLTQQTSRYMENAFEHLVEGLQVSTDNVSLHGREVDTVKHAEGIVWFEFEKICGVPRSQHDFIEVSKNYHTVFVSDLHVLQPGQLNLTTSFINLIDVFYDAGVRIVISAETDIEHLYPQGQLKFEFARTQSRLIEMRSDEYFNQRGREA